MNYWQNYSKFMVSVLKACYGKNAKKENEFGYAWLPKIDGNYSWMFIFDDMYRGNSSRAGGQEPGPEGLMTFGMNPVGIGPNTPKMIAAHSKLKWLVVVENHQVETATFWKAPKEYGGADPSKIQTEVFQLPASNFAEKDGSFTNSARWIQWKWKALDPPGQIKTDQEILARIFLAVRDLYRKEGGPAAEAVLNVDWSYTNPVAPDLSEVLKELNGKALEDIHDPKDKTKIIKTAGQQLDGFAPAPGRRLDDVRQLAHVGLLHGGRKHDPAAQQRRPAGPRNVPPVDLLLAGEPARHVQPGLRRRRGQALGSDAGRHQVERREVGRRRPRHEARRAPGNVRRLHHAARGRRQDLRAA